MPGHYPRVALPAAVVTTKAHVVELQLGRKKHRQGGSVISGRDKDIAGDSEMHAASIRVPPSDSAQPDLSNSTKSPGWFGFLPAS